jgi:hypothetical protein
VLYFKPEGYETVEKQLYRGSFKNDRYHGHGTLYWPGQDSIQYIGRFKAGAKHGRGIEFDEQGRKIYQGKVEYLRSSTLRLCSTLCVCWRQWYNFT